MGVVVFSVIGLSAFLAVSAPAGCDGYDPSSREVFDVLALPAGSVSCVKGPDAAVTRRLIGDLDGRRFLVNLSNGSAGLSGSQDGSEDWYLNCSFDATADRKICLLQKHDLNVFLVNDEPVVHLGKEYSPSTEIVLRVDDQPPNIGFSYSEPLFDTSVVLADLLGGSVVKTRFTHRLTGRVDREMSLAGFAAAYDLLQKMSDAYKK